MKRSRWYAGTAAAALCVLLCCLLFSCAKSEAKPSPLAALSFALETDAGRETIRVFQQDDAHGVVFLPSHARMDALTVQLPEAAQARLGETALTDGTTCGAFCAGTEYDLTVDGDAARLLFLQAQNVPALYVHPASGSMDRVHAQKDHKEAARLLLVTPDGSVAYRSVGADKIRGRGNSTWSKEKKPYNLYLSAAADLLGMGEAQNWALLANAFDETNLRNKLIFDFAKRATDDARFAPDTAFVDLYLEGDYAGLYLLSEKTEIAQDRLDVPPDSTLFSWVMTAREHTGFALNSTSSVQIESPDPCTEAQERALRAFLLTWQQALETDGSWEDAIDTQSFAHKYLIEEIFLNTDLYNSQYFYRTPDGILHAGPCWDCDLTLGVSWRNTWSTPRCFSAQNKQNENENWYTLLWQKDAFRTCVTELFRTRYLPLLQTLADEEIARQSAQIAASSEMNALRWRSLFGTRTTDEAVREMTDFLTQRTAFLRSAWVDGAQYCTLTLQHPNRYEYICVTPGTVCAEFPQPQQLDLPQGTVWLRADTGEPFDPQSVITDDLTLTLPPQPRAISRNTLAVVVGVAGMAAVLGAAAVFERVQRNRRRKR